jgi:hypothetical protein
MTRRAASLVLIGLLAMIAAPAQAEPTATLYLDGNVGGDVETDRGGAGLALGYYYRGRIGLELDVAYQFHFFKDEDVADLVPERVDLNTRAITAMANVVAPIPIPRAPIWLPYGSAGLGAVHAIFAADGSDELDRTQTNLAFNVGVGMKHRLTELVRPAGRGTVLPRAGRRGFDHRRLLRGLRHVAGVSRRHLRVSDRAPSRPALTLVALGRRCRPPRRCRTIR